MSRHFIRARATGRAQAAKAIAEAIRSGRLAPAHSQPCADCEAAAQCYDRRDYNKPLEVAPVCFRCNCRRGSAIPLRGAITALVNEGLCPFRAPRRVRDLIIALDMPAGLMRKIPSRLLNIEDWRQLAPAFAAAEAEIRP
jgi:hypothetical protein